MTSAQSLQHLIEQYPNAGEVVFAPTLELFEKPIVIDVDAGTWGTRLISVERDASGRVVTERPFDLTKSATGLSDRPAIREFHNERA